MIRLMLISMVLLVSLCHAQDPEQDKMAEKKREFMEVAAQLQRELGEALNEGDMKQAKAVKKRMKKLALTMGRGGDEALKLKLLEPIKRRKKKKKKRLPKEPEKVVPVIKYPHVKTGELDVRSLAISADGKRVIGVGRSDSAFVWDRNVGRCSTIKFAGQLEAIAMSNDGRTVAVGVLGGMIQLADIGTDPITILTLRKNGRSPRALCFSRDGKSLIAASIDKSVEVWDIAARKLTKKGVVRGIPRCIAISPDSKLIACGTSSQEVVLLRASDLSVATTMKGHTFAVRTVSFLPDGSRILSGSEDMTLRLWKLSGEHIQTLVGHFSLVTGAAVLPDGKRCISSSFDGTVRLWDLASGKQLSKIELTKDGVSCLAMTPDGSGLGIAGRNRLIYVLRKSDLQ